MYNTVVANGMYILFVFIFFYLLVMSFSVFGYHYQFQTVGRQIDNTQTYV
jgi:hypothetical protein